MMFCIFCQPVAKTFTIYLFVYFSIGFYKYLFIYKAVYSLTFYNIFFYANNDYIFSEVFFHINLQQVIWEIIVQ
jgi:hypothetical protein